MSEHTKAANTNTPGECLTLGGHDGSPCSRCGRQQPDRPRPTPLPRQPPCEDCGGRLSTTPGVIHTIQHTTDCWRHQYNACADCHRNHRDAEDCVFHGRRFDPDAHELVQAAQLALEHAIKVRQPGTANAHLWWDTLEAHLGVLIDDLPDALENGSDRP